MSESAVVHVRVDPKIKAKAERIFKRMGLSTSDAVRMFMAQAVADEGLPFQPHTPSAVTRKAIADVRAGRTEEVSVEDLRKQIFGDA